MGYTHQGWLTDDHRYFFLDDELDELAGTAPKTRTVVFDLADLEDPVVAKEFYGTTAASTTTCTSRAGTCTSRTTWPACGSWT